MTSSIPLLLATSAPPTTRARLVEWSSQAEEQVARALHQPRVGVVGVGEGTPGAEALLRFVRDNVDAIDVPWLDQIPKPIYHSVKIQTVESTSKPKSNPQGRKRKHRETAEGA
ncbi:hypothetical protein AYO22_03933 [Fonsecaea multimorphosa]|nr:hypothetical protein AYO22_03933 [Fonsecaea multimorphosa]